WVEPGYLELCHRGLRPDAEWDILNQSGQRRRLYLRSRSDCGNGESLFYSSPSGKVYEQPELHASSERQGDRRPDRLWKYSHKNRREANYSGKHSSQPAGLRVDEGRSL